MELNKFIDHTLLKNTATEEDFERLFTEASDNSFFSVCVPPHIVPFAKNTLAETNVQICSVASFPLGYSTIENKETEIIELFTNGCDEVDVVLNISNVKNKDWESVEEEFQIFSEISINRTLKVIIESGILTDEEIVKICEIANNHPVTFLKTSTGFAEKSASLEAVKLIREHTNKEILIKASGGVKNTAQAIEFVEAGADRLGCSASVAIVEGKK
jgi:deoxyribose-phosphate aldolase